jgi:peptide chain release factor subunit 3
MVFGKVESGTIEAGTKITITPSLLSCKILNIFNCKEEQVAYAKAGENIKVRLGGIEDKDLSFKGNVLCPRDEPMPVAQIFICEIEILELLEHKPIFS